MAFPKQEINGVLLLDKPINISSNQALMEVKRLYGAKKAGHTGSLDPLASGMLPICFGEATKFSQFLLEADKAYWVEATLGSRTTTGDAEGEVVVTKEVPLLSKDKLENLLNNFRGEIQQIPSMYSALKYQGKPLYTYARQGIEIERSSRSVLIRDLELIEFNQQKLYMTVLCSKGTYIRTLVEDIGELLGCGAFVSSLKRTYVEPYTTAGMITLTELKALQEEGQVDTLLQKLLPLDSALIKWPELCLTDNLAYYIKQGQPIIVPKAPTTGLVRLVMPSCQFIGVGQILSDGRVAPKRLVATNK